jgi:cation transport ATPase
VLFRSGEALECLAGVRAVRFDKTGTLTTGSPTIAAFISEEGENRDRLSRRARSLSSASTHVLAGAIRRYLKVECDASEAIATSWELERDTTSGEIRTLAGRGITGRVGLEATATYLGSRRLMEESGLQIGPRLDASAHRAEEEGRSLAFLGWDGRTLGLFVFDEQLRPSARPAVAQCRSLGLDVGVLTGDHSARGEALAASLGVAVESALLPEDKVAALCRARARFGPVAMVGDGVNDAPALAASDIGVAMGCGADLSRDSAAVCLLGDELDRFPWAVSLARRTVRAIRWNLLWAFGYNAVGVAFAAAGWLSPSFAAFLMVGSSFFVITNSLRLSSPATAEFAAWPDSKTEPAEQHRGLAAVETEEAEALAR